ncbi:MAG: YncE family protein [Usitatibacter sp.]
MNTNFLSSSWVALGRSLLAGLACWATAAAAAPFAYVPLSAENRVLVVDLATNAVAASVAVGADPAGIAINSSGNRIYVTSLTGSTVSVIDGFTNQVIRTIPVASQPFGVAVNAQGTKVAVATIASNSVSIIDTNTNAVTTVAVGASPVGVTFSPTGSRLYVSNLNGNSITVIDANTFTAIDSISVSSNPYGMAISADGSRLYVGHYSKSISIINTATRGVIANLPIDSVPEWIALSRDGSRLFIAKSGTQSMGVLSTADNRLFDIILRPGSRPSGVSVSPDGARVYVLADGTQEMTGLDTANYAVVSTLRGGNGTGAFGNFIGPASVTSGADSPGPLSGIWCNPNESGWGINFTQRHGNIFAAWYTYDSAGNAKWYVASNCAMPTGSSSCSGTLYQVDGPRFFGVPFNPAAERVTAVGSLSVAFSGNSNATMSYTVNGQSRTVAIQRQVFNSGATPPVTDFTDLWWNPNESGWGLAITQQYNIMFLAWYVYDGNGQPTWFVVPNCAVNNSGMGCVGDAYRTTGPPFGPTFDPAQVQVFGAGKMFLNFTDANNGQIDYNNDTLFVSKRITRQIF